MRLCAVLPRDDVTQIKEHVTFLSKRFDAFLLLQVKNFTHTVDVGL